MMDFPGSHSSQHKKMFIIASGFGTPGYESTAAAMECLHDEYGFLSQFYLFLELLKPT